MMNEHDEQAAVTAEKEIKISPLAHARSAYLGYATLARLAKESVDEGLSLIEIADEQQARKLGHAFSSAAQVLLEMNGLTETETVITLESGRVVEAELLGAKVEALQHSLPWVGKRYLSNLVGSVEDLELHVEHIPAIVELLIKMRGEPKRTERRSLDIDKMLSLRFAGLSTEEIASRLMTKPNRVKGAFQRFSDLIHQGSTIDERNKMFRSRLLELNLLADKRHMTDAELDAHLPSKALREASKLPKTRRIVKKDITAQSQTSQQEIADVQYTPPDDLLPGETIRERRARLREVEAETE